MSSHKYVHWFTAGVADYLPLKRLIDHSSAPPPLPSDPGLSIPVGGPSGDLKMRKRRAIREEGSGEQHRQVRVTADMLPNNVLLDVFDFYRIFPMFPENVYLIWEWHGLTHVCRKWREVIFASPRRLCLQLVCTPKTPVKKMLDIWPSLPIFVEKLPYSNLGPGIPEDNLLAALEQRDRVYVIGMDALTGLQLNKFAATMQEPFPMLTRLSLSLSSDDEIAPAPALPATLFGGSAPRLQRLHLKGISFPTLPRLVLSPMDFTSLNLYDIPSNGYISHGTMVAYLSPLIRLEELVIEFKSPRYPADPTSRRVTPPTRTLLPALGYFRFKGVSEYLEDMVAQIDAPLLRTIDAVLFNQAVFSIPRISQLIHRTQPLKSLNQAQWTFGGRNVVISFAQRSSVGFSLRIPCSPSDWQLSAIAQLCGPPLLLPSDVERLEVDEAIDSPKWQDDIDIAQWLEILQPFLAVQELHVSEAMGLRLAAVLKEHTGERAREVLPMLRDVFLKCSEPSESLWRTIEPFVAARQLSDHPVVVYCRDGSGDWKVVH